MENLKLLLGTTKDKLVFANIDLNENYLSVDFQAVRTFEPSDINVADLVEEVIDDMGCYDKLELLEYYDCRYSELTEAHTENMDERDLAELILNNENINLFDQSVPVKYRDDYWLVCDHSTNNLIADLKLIDSFSTLNYIVNEVFMYNEEETKVYEELKQGLLEIKNNLNFKYSMNPLHEFIEYIG